MEYKLLKTLILISLYFSASFCFGEQNDSLFKHIDLYTGASLSLPLNKLFEEVEFVPYAETQLESYKQPEDYADMIKASSTTSAKIVFKHATFIASASLPLSSLSTFASFASNDFSSFCTNIASAAKTSWGISLAAGTEALLYKATLLAGTLHYSADISRMKNPRLTSTSALRRLTPLSKGLSSSLPSRSSSSTAPALSVKLSPFAQKTFLPTLEAVCSSSGEFYISIFSNTEDIVFKKISFFPFSITSSLTAGVFSSSDDSTFSFTEPFFSDEKFFLLSFDISLTSPFLRSSNAFGFTEDPHNIFAETSSLGKQRDFTSSRGGWFRTEDALLFGPFNITLGFFAADKNLITASGTSLRTIYQAFVNPQCIFAGKEAPLRVGLLCGYDLRTTSSDPYAEYGIIKCRIDSSYKIKKTLLAAKAGFSFSEDDGFPVFTTSASFTKPFEKIKTSCSTSADFLKTTQTYSARISLSSIKIFLTESNSISISTSNGSFKNGSGNLSLSIQGSIKHVKWSGKIAFLFSF